MQRAWAEEKERDDNEKGSVTYPDPGDKTKASGRPRYPLERIAHEVRRTDEDESGDGSAVGEDNEDQAALLGAEES